MSFVTPIISSKNVDPLESEYIISELTNFFVIKVTSLIYKSTGNTYC